MNSNGFSSRLERVMIDIKSLKPPYFRKLLESEPRKSAMTQFLKNLLLNNPAEIKLKLNYTKFKIVHIN